VFLVLCEIAVVNIVYSNFVTCSENPVIISKEDMLMLKHVSLLLAPTVLISCDADLLCKGRDMEAYLLLYWMVY